MIKKFIAISLLSSFLVVGALPLAMAETTTTSTPTSTPVKTHKPHPELHAAAIDVTCIQQAIDTRDSALSTAVDAYATAVKNALSARQSALKSAWALTNKKDRQAAIKNAWLDYRKAIKKARKDLGTARQNAWKDYYSSKKSCKVMEGEPYGGQGADANL